jgi:hypothetical protein
MPIQQAFIPFAQEEVDRGHWELPVEFFSKGGGKDHIADESRLNDED